MKAILLIGINMDEVKRVLGKVEPKEQNKVLKKALKVTAEQARDRLSDKAQSAYTIRNAGFKRAMKIKSTSSGNPSATIRSEGEPIPLKEFKVRRGRVTKVQVVKSGSMKPLVYQRSGIKAFVNNIANKNQIRKRDTKKGKKGTQVKHMAVAQREGAGRLGIHEKFSNSIPVMLGSDKHVFGVVEPFIAGDLQENLRKFVDQVLGG
ncbi:hypothetical protein [Clostridium sp. AN503]|uniref:hypothetical protein n=1 Tax=Clostridium sp. AN503 TaxID=3160598 RepID=UPI0034580BBC